MIKHNALPPHYYNDPNFFQSVSRSLFLSTWQMAGHRSQLKISGDFFCITLFDQDLFIILDNETPRAFYNVCQHRGHKLILQQSGHKKLLTCPYHAWSYGLNGQLKSAPNTESLPNFNREGIRLTEVRLEVFCQFIFINCNHDAAPMDQIFKGLRTAITDICPDIETRQFVHEHSVDETCNWLLAVENYNECYHCKVAHPDFSKGVVDPTSYNVSHFNDSPCLHHEARSSKGQNAWYNNNGEDYHSFYMWPGCSIQIYPGGMVNTYYWRPQSVNLSRVHRGWFSKTSTIDDDLQKVIDLDRETTFAEDLQILKNVQRGLYSLGYKPGPLVCHPQQGIESEHSIVCLHQWLHEAQAQFIPAQQSAPSS